MTDQRDKAARALADWLTWAADRHSGVPKPDVILALLEERKVLREAAKEAAGFLDRYAAMRDETPSRPFRRHRDALRAALQAEPAREGSGTP